MTTIVESLRQARSTLAKSGVAEPAREAISLVMFATARDRTFIYAHPEYELARDELARLDSLLRRRANREPLQYISGLQEFFGLEFEVTADVLIPRPETEMVVEQAIKYLDRAESPRFCEVGVGSGCISVSILFHVTAARGLATDISPAALEVAARNSRKHRVAKRLRLIESNLFDALADEQFDLIVSNPPYIPLRDIAGLQPEVRDFEPRIALTDGGDGLSIVRRIVERAPEFLRPGGALLMEIGVDQGDLVHGMFDPVKWRPLIIFPDLRNIARTVLCERR